MDIGGGLSYVTGPMGAGKTLFACRRIVQGLTSGKYVVTNVRLLDGWENYAARRILRYSPLSWHKENMLAAKLRSRYIYLEHFEDATFFKLPEQKVGQESRGLMIWDEVHNDMNNRDWMEDGKKELLKWATQLRKLGWQAFFLSQHADNTDVGLRRVCSWTIKLQNQKEQTRLLGMKVTPWPLFLAFWYPANVVTGRAQPAKIERYFLSWHRKIYNTLDLYHGLHSEFEANTRILNLPVGGIEATALAAWKADRERERLERQAQEAKEIRRKKGSAKKLSQSGNATVRLLPSSSQGG